LIRHPAYTRERLAATSARLWAQVRPETVAPDELLVAGPVDRISYDAAQQLEYRPAVPGERYGPLWATYWFRLGATLPEQWAGRRVDLIWASPAESTLWIDGSSIQGLHGTAAHERPDATVPDSALGAGRIELAIELACNGLFGDHGAPPEIER
jgi:alpha-mannosidase